MLVGWKSFFALSTLFFGLQSVSYASGESQGPLDRMSRVNLSLQQKEQGARRFFEFSKDSRNFLPGEAGKVQFLKSAEIAFDQVSRTLEQRFAYLGDQELEALWDLAVAASDSEHIGEWIASVSHLPVRERLARIWSDSEKRRYLANWRRYLSKFDGMTDVAREFNKQSLVKKKYADDHYVPLFPTTLWVLDEYDDQYGWLVLTWIPDVIYLPVGLFWNIIVLIWDIFEETPQEERDKNNRRDARNANKDYEIRDLKNRIKALERKIEELIKSQPNFDG